MIFHWKLSSYISAFFLSLSSKILSEDTKATRKKDLYRTQSKGRRRCLGERIYLIPCLASCFKLGWYEEKDEFIRGRGKQLERQGIL